MNNENKVKLNSLYGEILSGDNYNAVEIMSAIANLEEACEVFKKYKREYLAEFLEDSDSWRALYNKVDDLSSEIWRVQVTAEEREEKQNEEDYNRGR